MNFEPLWGQPPYDPAAPLRNPRPGYPNSGFDSLGRWWWGAPIATAESASPDQDTKR